MATISAGRSTRRLPAPAMAMEKVSCLRPALV